MKLIAPKVSLQFLIIGDIYIQFFLIDSWFDLKHQGNKHFFRVFEIGLTYLFQHVVFDSEFFWVKFCILTTKEKGCKWY